jgi:hypothetical protein
MACFATVIDAAAAVLLEHNMHTPLHPLYTPYVQNRPVLIHIAAQPLVSHHTLNLLGKVQSACCWQHRLPATGLVQPLAAVKQPA